jgi:cytochrome-b5 reductase
MFQSTSQQVAGGGGAGNTRRKVGVAVGHSLMDWMRRVTRGEDLASSSPPTPPTQPRARPPRPGRVSLAELRAHCTADDAWMAIRGCVYNVTPYHAYHPGGGAERLRGAGTDATALFDEYHHWVNIQQMFARSFVGMLDSPPAAVRVGGGGGVDARRQRRQQALLSVPGKRATTTLTTKNAAAAGLGNMGPPAPRAAAATSTSTAQTMPPPVSILSSMTANAKAKATPFRPCAVVGVELITDAAVVIRLAATANSPVRGGYNVPSFSYATSSFHGEFIATALATACFLHAHTYIFTSVLLFHNRDFTA